MLVESKNAFSTGHHSRSERSTSCDLIASRTMLLMFPSPHHHPFLLSTSTHRIAHLARTPRLQDVQLCFFILPFFYPLPPPVLDSPSSTTHFLQGIIQPLLSKFLFRSSSRFANLSFRAFELELPFAAEQPFIRLFRGKV
ncbi:hypothetical protein BAUCODRAFT_525514 [Baudoinia panamericana UAMH 10762]|uniref:Uncharacterized protein n=1 Tax=Baudoinia panamericana (strain UAMH 10762) TaxID=717646 RepID=M2N8E1_BAUPA|nr:uncharacterized protein BAUCODRAFT_525514 [Baudoinia panamericana UAMH 10762]EMC95085.1 hypothetical protein BAUCODRAFT_525514 [Baudoinia panamericana UAMH 10762]